MKTSAPSLIGALLVAIAGALGCTSTTAPDPGAFATTPAATVTSDSNTFRLALYSAPEVQPSRGLNSFRLVVTKVADESPASGLEIAIVPWMPAMGHGASVRPSVDVGTDPGVYLVSNVNLFMPGLWELRTTIGGSESDHATAQFEID